MPADAFKMEDAEECILFVKCDESFERVILENVKCLQSRLSKLLKTDLIFLRVEDGCTELVFDTTCSVFPLTKYQRDQLLVMGILSIRYQSTTYFASGAQPENTTFTGITDYEMAYEIQAHKKVEKLAALGMSGGY